MKGPGIFKWTWALYERTKIPYIWISVSGVEIRLQCWPPFRSGEPPRFRWDVAPGTATCSFGYTFDIDTAYKGALQLAEREAILNADA